MIFINTNDVKLLINMILDKIDKNNEFYNDFKWFSKVNYTTTTEYYGELRIFLKKILDLKVTPAYKNEVQELYLILDKKFSANGGI